jgi:hypothetical protein
MIAADRAASAAHPLAPAQAASGLAHSNLPAGNLYGEPTAVTPPELAAILAALRPNEASDPVAADPANAAGMSAEHSGHDEIIDLPAVLYAETPEPPQAMPYREELRAAGLGLIAGLCFMAPAALWFGAFMPRETPTIELAALSQPAGERTRYARLDAQPSTDDTRWTDAEASAGRARSMMVRGDVAAARTELATAATALNANALFAMAETWDPNVLAALGTRGVQSDANRARELYVAAAALGHSMAQARIQALK